MMPGVSSGAPLPSCPNYVCHQPHRNNSPEKSQWTISEEQERECFEAAWSEGWVDADHAWGVHPPTSGTLAGFIGTSADGERKLWFAKFVGAAWHGYPADLVRRGQHDAPPKRVAKDWADRGHIRKQTLSKLIRGVKCVP